VLKILKNPIPDKYKEISTAVMMNGGYCPCKIHKSDDTKCPCKEFRDQEEVGYCHCGRYYKDEVETK
jgi:ferredoxin-thioredoxin reductase catalytic subunit